MRTALVLAGALLFGSVAAQDPVETEPKASAAERLQELQDLQRKVIKDWRDAQKAAQEAAKSGAGGFKAVPMRPDFSPLTGKAKQFAAEFAGTDDAVPFLLMVVNYSAKTDIEAAKAALATLADAHVDSEQLSQMVPMLPYLGQIVDKEFATATLKKLANSKNESLRNHAVVAIHKQTIQQAPIDGDEYQAARKALLALVEKITDKRLVQEIRGSIDEREKFGIGCTAPDIEGVDLDGVAFKLSDYRGKVLFVDFWGDW